MGVARRATCLAGLKEVCLFDYKSASFVVAALAIGSVLNAADVKPIISAADIGDALVLAAPPRESAEEAIRIYQPLVDYLVRVTGKRIVFRYPRTWGVYRTEMINGRYDLVFDGPHFNSYRAEKMGHRVLVKLSDNREFAIIARKDEKIGTLDELVGRTMCVNPPPNLGTLVALSQFDNPARQPILVPAKGWNKVYSGVTSGRCVSGAIAFSSLEAFDKDHSTKVLFKSKSMPEQALSAGPRVSAADQAKIIAALTSPDGVAPTEKLRAAAKGGDRFVATDNQEYAGIASVLKREWGFYDN